MTGPRRHGVRAVVGAVLVFLLVAGQAATALAHGFPTAGPPNWISAVTGAPQAGLDWQVVGVDAAIRLVNGSGEEVLVRGYADEPYLRVGPEGVFENRRSTATHLNRNRLGDLTSIVVPDDVDNAAPPDWVQVGDDPEWTWFDHRIHWIAPTRLPPGVEADPDLAQVVSRWTIPAEIDGIPVGPDGELRWVPTGEAVRGVLVGALVALAALAAAATRRRGAVVVAAVLAVITLAAGWSEIGALRELGPVVGSGAITAAWLRSVALVLGAVACLVALARGDERARWLVAALGVAIAVTIGWREVDVVSQPAVPGPLPLVAARALVAVALAVGPASLVLLLGWRPKSRNDSYFSRRTG